MMRNEALFALINLNMIFLILYGRVVYCEEGFVVCSCPCKVGSDRPEKLYVRTLFWFDW